MSTGYDGNDGYNAPNSFNSSYDNGNSGYDNGNTGYASFSTDARTVSPTSSD